MRSLSDVPTLALSDEVAEGLASGRPLVALESTLLAFGLPPGRRSEVALLLERTVRGEGAVPATVAVVDGRLQVGLDDATLGRVIEGEVSKASIRDLAPAVALGGIWATTVASTMAIAHRAGIRWFATGGIGGVHRGASETFDESADLTALAKYPVGVVSAGVKSILDLPRTLQRLETLGVPVVGYRTDELPAFYHPHSGLRLGCRVTEVEHVARIGVARFDRLGEAGLLVVQPPPGGAARDRDFVESLIAEALSDAAERGIGGAELTPYLLGRLAETSDGALVETNVALVESNARLAARVAVAAARLDALFDPPAGDAG